MAQLLYVTVVLAKVCLLLRLCAGGKGVFFTSHLCPCLHISFTVALAYIHTIHMSQTCKWHSNKVIGVCQAFLQLLYSNSALRVVIE